MIEWYYRLGEDVQGPVSEEDLNHIFESRALPEETRVWCQGMQDWVEAVKINGLNQQNSKSLNRPPHLLQNKSAFRSVFTSIKWVISGVGILCLAILFFVYEEHRVQLKDQSTGVLHDRVKNSEANNDQANGVSGIPEPVGWEPLSDDYDKMVKAAQDGDAQAQYALGIAFDFRAGMRIGPEIAFGGQTAIDATYKESAMWLKKAAEQNVAGAEVCLGRAYYLGKGVEKNDAEAVKWLKKASAQGLAVADQVLDEINYSASNRAPFGSDAQPNTQSKQRPENAQDDFITLDPRTISNPYMTTDLYGPVVSGKLSSISRTDLDLVESRGLSEQQSIYTVMLIRKFGFNVSDVLAEWDVLELKQGKWDERNINMWNSFLLNAFLEGKKNRGANK